MIGTVTGREVRALVRVAQMKDYDRDVGKRGLWLKGERLHALSTVVLASMPVGCDPEWIAFIPLAQVEGVKSSDTVAFDDVTRTITVTTRKGVSRKVAVEDELPMIPTKYDEARAHHVKEHETAHTVRLHVERLKDVIALVEAKGSKGVRFAFSTDPARIAALVRADSEKDLPSEDPNVCLVMVMKE